MNPDGTRRGKPIARHDSQSKPVPEMPRIYHVWVNLARTMSNASQTYEYPGLVLGWRRGIDGYEAQVVWVTPNNDRSADSSHIGWIAAHQLKPRD